MKNMKLFIVLLLAVLINNTVFGQSGTEEYQKEINKKAELLKQKLEAKEYISDFEKQTVISFKTDTFKVEQMLSLRMDNDYTTTGMVNTMYEAEKEYDKLLNKYYKILLKKLNESDQEALKQSQRNWIKFRDSERNLNGIISKPEYSGGGTIQNIFVASEYFEITKNRVIELYHYISRFFEY
ncbi:MAG: DUF1311 domain-containing protein [Bacteroidales bacterium]|nr:DUF1311 domain-containing protein [Bacteroidales bacterium]